MNGIKRPVSEVLDVLDQAGVRAYVDLDGMWGENLLHQHLDYFKAAAPDRFRVLHRRGLERLGRAWEPLWRMVGNPPAPACRARSRWSEGVEGLWSARCAIIPGRS